MRRALVGAAVLTAGAGIGAPVAAASPAVSFVSPAAGTAVSGNVSVTVATASPYARLGVYTTADATYTWKAPVPVTSGQASATIPSWGFGSLLLAAEACDGPTADTCTSTPAVRSVSPANPAPVLQEPSDAVFTKPADDGPLTLHLGDAGGGVLVAGLRHQGASKDALTLGPVSAGTDVPVDLSGVPDATYVLHVARCSTFVPTACTGDVLSPPVTVGNKLDVSLPYVAPVFSPNGDGRQDDLSALVDLDPDIPQTVQWSLRQNGATVVGPVALDGGAPLLGAVWPDLDAHGALGHALPSGEYQLVLAVHGQRSGHTYDTTLTAPVTSDVTPDRVVSVTPQWRSFYPVADGYRDRLRIDARTVADLDATPVMEVLDANGTRVRGLRLSGGPRSWTATWDGRYTSGGLAPAGTYRVRMTTTDPVGNVARRDATVDLTQQHLVRREWHHTVTAAASLVSDGSGRCSAVRRPGLARRPASLLYASLGRCGSRTGNADRAMGVHAWRLPQAAVPGRVHLTLYGGNVRGNHPAYFDYLGRSGRLVGGMEYHGGVAARPSTSWTPGRLMVRPDDTIRWRLRTFDGGRFAVATYHIDYTYQALS